MSFAELNAAVVALTEGLRIHVDTNSIASVNTRPPASSDDEVGFLRLTTWSYSLIFEAGRTSIALLLSVPPANGASASQDRHRATVEAVQQLRTWLHHNLGFDSDRELSIRRAVSEWFIQACGATAPMTPDQWAKCFGRLCADVKAMVDHCLEVLSGIMRSVEDREQVLETWRCRLQRNWEAHRFDQLVADSASRLGESINARAFRERRLPEWKRFLESIPEQEDPVPKMERLIDLEVFNHVRAAPPFGAKDLMAELGLSPGPTVKEALRLLREGFEGGINAKPELLKYVRDRLELPQEHAGGV